MCIYSGKAGNVARRKMPRYDCHDHRSRHRQPVEESR